jgi:hypothetical protein
MLLREIGSKQIEQHQRKADADGSDKLI